MAGTSSFDNEKYLEEQSSAILKRVRRFNNKLYLEFGGKLLFDLHASRVLPGFDPNVKMRLLHKLRKKADVIMCIYAGDIERKKMRADFGITYDSDVLKTIDDFAKWDLPIKAVVITRYENQPAARAFKNKLERRDIKVYLHKLTKGYPLDVDTIVSDEGYGRNPYIETQHPIAVVTGPGPGSGKLATCLTQLYHEYRRGIKAGYAKFETFPIWNLPLKHEVNLAYEAATVDLKDVNLIDNFHLEAYNEVAINYNRDVEAFPLLRRIIEKITGKASFYKSPTDMGVNRAGYGIVDDKAVRLAASQEIIRRYFRYSCEYALGLTDKDSVDRTEHIMKEINVGPVDRLVVLPARRAAMEGKRKGKGNEGIFCGAALELRDGTVIKGCNSPLMHAASALIIKAVKHLSEIPGKMPLLPCGIIESLSHFKKDVLNRRRVSLDVEEVLIALSISANMNPAAQLAVEKLKVLKGCDMHMTHIPSPGDQAGLIKLGINLTSDPEFPSKALYMS